MNPRRLVSRLLMFAGMLCVLNAIALGILLQVSMTTELTLGLAGATLFAIGYFLEGERSP